jgi:hypothetical protein
MPSTLTAARISTSRKLAGLELPLAFQLGTIAAADLALTRETKSAKASRCRLVEKATKLAGMP